MTDVIDTPPPALNAQYDPSLCPAWCDRHHLTDLADPGYRHTLELGTALDQNPELGEEENGLITVLVAAPDETARVEIQDYHSVVAVLTPEQAIAHAQALMDAARHAGPVPAAAPRTELMSAPDTRRPVRGDFVRPRPSGNVHIAWSIVACFSTHPPSARVQMACGARWNTHALVPGDGDRARQCHRCWEAARTAGYTPAAAASE